MALRFSGAAHLVVVRAIDTDRNGMIARSKRSTISRCWKALHRDVLNARRHVARYDPIVQETNALRESLGQLLIMHRSRKKQQPSIDLLRRPYERN